MQKEVIIVAGPNGSGKTTFAYDLLKEYNQYGFVNADEIAKELDSENLDAVRLKAGRLFFKKLYEFANENRNFVIETTISGNYLKKVFHYLREHEYSITTIFIFLETPEVCINRIQERVRKGEHSVPDSDVIRRFFRSKNNFWNIYKNFSDKWYLIYNSSDDFQEVAIGEREQYIINDEELFKVFLNDINDMRGKINGDR